MMGLATRKLRRAAVAAFSASALLFSANPAAADNAPAQTFDQFINGPNGAVLDGREADPVGTGLRQNLFAVARPDKGRIGVAAMDLSTGQTVSILGDQAFPMASTSKIAIAATFLAGVDAGRYRLDDKYPLMIPVASRPFSTSVAPVKPGMELTARSLIELMITRSDNTATDAMLKAVGGPAEVTKWMRSKGFERFRIDRDIATLVRDDGEFDPATGADQRDSTPPNEMVRLIAGLYKGEWLSGESTDVVIGAMTRTVTGSRRIKAGLPSGVDFGHKTGTLNNTASDVGFVEMPDGRVVVMAIYVTGQGGRPQRDARIAEITRTLYAGFANPRFATNASNDNSRVR
ncbi:serine hydrolase [Croceicoccus pelagius]|uniref:Beta-lactamase n=1 Tax=Croceicoccus pelagius TaxID=1703341 RepID=A0A916Y9I3_9SPHN|nr:serine hydrolase [Croceicoccus pelagius]GGD36423.1 beta-lactamase [Croceicoccus pelagius]